MLNCYRKELIGRGKTKMKKLICLLTVALMLLPSATALAREAVLTPSGASDGVKLSGDISLKADEFIRFSEVDFSGVKSIRMTGEGNFTSNWNSDIFELRLDAENGRLLGYIDFAKEGEGTFGLNVNVSGTHDLYIGSVYGPAGASKIKSVFLSAEPMKSKEQYAPVDDECIVDSLSDTWAAVSGLSRKVADYAEVGAPKEGRSVGLFYWNWNVDEHDTLNLIDNTAFQKEHPEAYGEGEYYNKAWPSGKTIYFHSEPLYGYYAGNDYWVYRRDAELLSDAGIDFIFLDYTNGKAIYRRNLNVLLRAFRDARAAGTDVPKIVFASNMTVGVSETKYMLKALYLILYKDGGYSDLWYYHEGKPLIMAHEENMTADENDPADVELTNEILDFFTFRGIEGDWLKSMTRKDNKWTIAEEYPQRTFGVDSEGNAEMVIAAAANNRSIETERLAPMSTPYIRDKSYTEAYGHDLRDGAFVYNYYFEEQMAGALATDAKILLISSWNEWTAVRNENYSGKFRNSFIDHFDEAATRDLALSAGTNRDNGYMLLCDAVRKWKGVRPVPKAGEYLTISMEEPFSWDAAEPTFYNTKGVYNRDCEGYTGLKYENSTARNNIVLSKAARDEQYIWFTANTEGALTGEETDNFMVLYIDSDRNHATGWEGYDFRVRKKAVEKYSDGRWVPFGEAEYKVKDKAYTLRLEKALIGMGEVTNIEFKWADNSDDSDILNFYLYGIAAPSGRFNYVFTDVDELTVGDKDRELLKTATVLKANSTKAVVHGGIVNAYEANTAYGVINIDGNLYFPASLLSDALGYGTTKVIYEADRAFLKIDTGDKLVYTTVGSLSAVVNGRDTALSSPTAELDGVAYVPVSMMEECFELDIVKLDDNTAAFGEDIGYYAAERAAELI